MKYQQCEKRIQGWPLKSILVLSMGLEMVTGPTPCKLYDCDYYTLRFLNRALWFTYVIEPTKCTLFFINDLIQLYCLQHVSNIQEWSSSGRLVHAVVWYFFMSPYKQSGRWQDVLDTIKLHAQIFLRMDTWLSETCWRKYNWIKSLMKKCAFCWF